MSSIPPDIYQRVRDLALAITNASEAEDDVLQALTLHCDPLLCVRIRSSIYQAGITRVARCTARFELRLPP